MYKFVNTIKTAKKNIITDTIAKIISSVKTLCTGYEVITGPCIPYYDFEREYNTEAERSANYQTDLDGAINSLSMYKQHRVIEFTACGYDKIKKKYKNSFHFRIRGFGYYSNNSQIQKIDGFDTEVYHAGSQLFRLPYASKEGQNRPLKRFNSKTGEIIELDNITEKYEDYLVQNIGNEKLIEVEITTKIPQTNTKIDIEVLTPDEIDKYIKKASDASDILKDFTYKSHTSTEKSIIINFNRRCSSHCKICDRTHDTDNTLYLSVMHQSNKIFYGCLKTKNKAQFICNIDDTKQSIDIERKSPDLPNTIFVNEKYCADIPQLTDSIKNATPLIVLKSNMGTGKTYCVAETINKIDWAAVIGLISFRVSLAEKYAEDFSGFVCYNNKTGVIDADKWVCQADSLNRIKSTKPLDILILDEVDQLRKHMTATTFLNNSNFNANRASLKYIVKSAKQIIIMSANITKDDINWIESMRTKQASIVITNTYITESRKINISKVERVIESIQNDYKNGRKFIIAHNGATVKQEALRRQISKNPDDILLINSETMSTDAVKRALKNPKVELQKYMGIMYSPSVQSGFSYDEKNVFHSIYGIFGNSSNSSTDICQMLHRIRHPISNEIMVSVDMANYSASKPTNKDDMIRYLKTGRSHIFNNTKDTAMSAILNRIPFEYNRYGEIDFTESEILNEYCSNGTEHNLDSILYKKNFINLQLGYGNTVVFDEEKGLKKTRTDMKKFNIEVNLDIATDLHAAIEIDDTTAVELKKKIKITPELVEKKEYTQVKKYNINKLYKIKGNSPEWYLKYGKSSTKNHYYNLSTYYKKDQSLELSLADLKITECINDVYRRVDEDQVKETEICVVDSILNKPKYMKHRVIIGWLDVLGFNKLDSTLEIKQEDLKANLAIILNNTTENDFDCLEKQQKGLDNLRKLKPSDPRFVGNMLKFINGSLQSEFNIKVNKKSKNSDVYVLFNDYITDKIFLNPYTSAMCEPFIPILGSIKDKSVINTNTSDEPYDSDDED